MAANDIGTKFQINYKMADGTLVNIYADSSANLEKQLANIQDAAELIKSVGGSLGATNQAPANVAYAKRALGATPVAAPAGAAPDCKHGSMNFRSGTGTKGPWKAWMCSAPKEATDKCDAVWIR